MISCTTKSISITANTGYSGLGFHEIYFVEDFENLENYYERPYPTDASLYGNLVNWYENMPEGLQASERGEQMEDNISALDNSSEMLEEAKALIEDAIVEIADL